MSTSPVGFSFKNASQHQATLATAQLLAWGVVLTALPAQASTIVGTSGADGVKVNYFEFSNDGTGANGNAGGDGTNAGSLLTSGPFTLADTFTGGKGGNGSSGDTGDSPLGGFDSTPGGYGGKGGAGGNGFQVTGGTTITIAGIFTGGQGGNAGSGGKGVSAGGFQPGAPGGVGGAGGKGGAGLVAGGTSILRITGTLLGGNGGNSGAGGSSFSHHLEVANGAAGGLGGDGGWGLTTLSAMTVQNEGTITGGNAGQGAGGGGSLYGAGGAGGSGGNGGGGVQLATNATLLNSGTITGGNAAFGGSAGGGGTTYTYYDESGEFHTVGLGSLFTTDTDGETRTGRLMGSTGTLTLWNSGLGGDGVELAQGTVRNTGTIQGGAGAFSTGGAGIFATGSSGTGVIENSGRILGGSTYTSNATPRIIQLNSGFNPGTLAGTPGIIIHSKGNYTTSITNKVGGEIAGGYQYSSSGPIRGNAIEAFYTAGATTNVSLRNEGVINGTVQLLVSTRTDLTLVAGGVINGEIFLPENNSLTLEAGAGQVQNFSSAVTGRVYSGLEIFNSFSGFDVRKTGAGTWVLDSATQKFGDRFTIQEGTLKIASSKAMDSHGTRATIQTGGTLDLGGFQQALQLNGSGTVTNSGADVNLRLYSDSFGTTSFAGTIADGTGKIAVTIGFSPTTPDITISGNNTYTGGTTVNIGLLKLTGNGTLGSGRVDLASGSRLDVSGITATSLELGSISGAGAVTLGGKTLIVGADNTSSTYTGAVTGGSITKNGTGTLTMSGSSSFTGGTITINSGTLSLNGVNLANTGIALKGGVLKSTIAHTGTINVEGNASLSGSFGTVQTGTDASRTINTTGGLNVTTLTGQGVFNGGNVSINGVHNPGNSPGVQIFNSGLSYGNNAVVNLEIAANGSAFDQIIVDNGLSIGTNVILHILLNGASDYTTAYWDTDRSFSLIAVDEVPVATTGSFIIESSGLGTAASEGSWSFTQSGSGVVANWTAVPEPSVALLSGLGALALFRRRRVA